MDHSPRDGENNQPLGGRQIIVLEECLPDDIAREEGLGFGSPRGHGIIDHALLLAAPGAVVLGLRVVGEAATAVAEGLTNRSAGGLGPGQSEPTAA